MPSTASVKSPSKNAPWLATLRDKFSLASMRQAASSCMPSEFLLSQLRRSLILTPTSLAIASVLSVRYSSAELKRVAPLL